MGWSRNMMATRYNAPDLGAGDGRSRLIKAIHAAARSRGIDADSRHALQKEVTGKESLTDMTVQELARVLDRINGKERAAAPHRPWAGKIRALWWTLYWLGEIHDTSDKGIDAFVKRQGGVVALRFLDHRGAPAVIEALKSWAKRAGVEWPVGEDSRADRRAVLEAIAARIGSRYDWRAAAVHALGHHKPVTTWTEAELDVMIRTAGAALRGQKARA